MDKYIIESLLLGLSLGPVCLAYCSPIVIPLLASSNNSKLSAGSMTLIWFLFGRFFGYLLVGIIVGIIGSNIHQYINGHILGTVSIALGLVLVYYGIQKNYPGLKLCGIVKYSGSRKLFLMVLGLLTGLNLCPPFITAIAGAINLGTISGSILYFSIFFIGTVVFFPLMILFGLFSKIEAIKNIAAICMLISGVWFFFRGIMSFL